MDFHAFLSQGQETSAILLAWCMQMLAIYPNLQEKLYMEIENVVGKRSPSQADVANLSLSVNYV